MKKILAIALIFAMICTLSGCRCLLIPDGFLSSSDDTSSYVEIIEPEDNTIVFKKGNVYLNCEKHCLNFCYLLTILYIARLHTTGTIQMNMLSLSCG